MYFLFFRKSQIFDKLDLKNQQKINDFEYSSIDEVSQKPLIFYWFFKTNLSKI